MRILPLPPQSFQKPSIQFSIKEGEGQFLFDFLLEVLLQYTVNVITAPPPPITDATTFLYCPLLWYIYSLTVTLPILLN